MNLSKEKTEELKKAHPEGVYQGEMTFTDADDKFHKAEFVFRAPVMADIESHSKSAQRNPIVANLNLIQSLIVHPEPGPIIDAIREFPIAYGRFVEEVLAPFFGGSASSRRARL